MIVFQQVTKEFNDGTQALKKVSFQIKPGEFVFFTGSSGAGKTTIMKLLRREILPSSGTILVNELDLSQIKKSQISDLRRDVAICFQDFKLLNHRTVFENVALSLEIDGLKKEEIQEKTMEALEKVSLKKKQKLFPVQLSGGELQRVGIARAIVSQPSVLIADEPTGNLDPKSGFKIFKLFKEINLSGTTVLVATHDSNIVDKFEERVIVIQKGTVIKDSKKGKYQS
ncbi:MAG: cell division ATP-binding protein FtsE [Candidatus Beckwithbacteria bacterium]|nr:cell division ATP-binding protein FtsE [Patescibacteria group bacterium]